MSALQHLLGLASDPDPFRNVPDDLYELQLEAARERVAERRRQIPLLDRRASDEGITDVRHREDLVPLLFADANYKSYPESFVEKGRWERMTLWLQTLSTRPIEGIDHERIRNMDDWVAELRRNGHYVMSSSGTSGKQSFLNQSAQDREYGWKLMLQGMRWSVGNFRRKSRGYPVFALLPSGGSYTATERTMRFIEEIAAPGDVHYMSHIPQSAQDLWDAGRLRREIAAGTAMPGAISEFEERSRRQAEKVQKDFAAFRDKLFARRHEPLFIIGMMATLYAVVADGKARGIADGDFHPDSVISVGGGKKGSNLPADFEAQCQRFFGLDENNFNDGYGMAEMSGFCPISHRTGGWAVPPWIVPLVLDKHGEKLLNPADGRGEVEGRFAFVDLLVDGRWGGLISGDRVTVDFRPNRDGIKTAIVSNLARYRDLDEGDDKLSCAGTIDSYIRGVVAS